jgi:hypothetical protein
MHVARKGNDNCTKEFFSENLKGRHQFGGRPRCIWEDNIKMDLTEVEYGIDSYVIRIGSSD